MGAHAGSLAALVSGLAECARGFAPSEDLLDAFAHLLASLVRLAASGASVQTRGLAGRMGGDMGSDLPIAASADKGLRMVASVRTNAARVKTSLRELIHLPKRLLRLGHSRCRRHVHQNTQSVPVLHRGVREETKPGLLAIALAQESGLRIRLALVGVVAAFAAAKIIPSVRVARSIRTLLLRAEALHRSPRFDQSPVDTEVLVADPVVAAGQFNDLREENLGGAVVEQPLHVLREDRRMKGTLTRIHVQKPLKKQVVVEPLAELPVAPNRVQRHKNLRLQQPFRRHRRPAQLLVHLVKVLVHPPQYLVDHLLDRTDRMLRRNAVLQVHQCQEIRLILSFSTHALIINRAPPPFQTFSAAC